MYVADSSRRVLTHQRPKIPKLTASLPHGHHFLEDALTWPSVRRALGWLTRPDGDGKSLFEKLCEHYDRPGLRWTLPNLMIGPGLKTAHLDRETMKKNLFHHPPTVKALALTARSIATYGLTVPQRFTAPLFVVWNLTQACNLSCRHCYQNAAHQPTSDELTREQKLGAIDQMGEEFVPFLALAGGEPMVSKDLWAVLE
ncbi:MAG TPA: radical SAM protein, partial [Terriglobales bacterium]|nr:radical SAM protein [Terriglobales bacterium]